MFAKDDVQRFLRRTFFWFSACLTVLMILQIAISFWGNWGVCQLHYQDKILATKSDCPKVESEHMSKACHQARHGLSVPPFLCATYETVEDVHKIMWFNEVKALMGNLWFALLLALGLGLAVFYCTMNRGGGGGGYGGVSVVYPTQAWMDTYHYKNAQSRPLPSSLGLDRPGVTIPAKMSKEL